jgi:trk system potassium uptake protein TrkA
MKIVIMGCGRVGILLVQELCKAGHEVAVIDKNASAFDRLPPDFKAKTIVGLGFDRNVLEEAGIRDADVFLAVSSGDNSNIVSARVAREHYRVPMVIARIYDPYRADIYERLNIPTVSTTRWGVKQMVLMLTHTREEIKESLAGGDLFRMRLAVPSHLVGRQVSELAAEGKGARRGGRPGRVRLHPGPVQHVPGRRHGPSHRPQGRHGPARRAHDPDRRALMRIVIAGAGAVGRHLAADLKARGHDVVLVEQEPRHLEIAAEWAPDAEFILGDACEPWVLEKADLRSTDVVVAATGDDEDNLVISLLSKQEFGVPRVLARVNHPRNEWMFSEQWGVDQAVSIPHLMTALVEEAVTVGDLVRLLRLEGGRIALLEITIPDASPNAGRPLYELRLPTDAAIVAVLREGHVVIPQPETVVTAGDEVLALASAEAESALRLAIVGEGMPGGTPASERGSTGAI